MSFEFIRKLPTPTEIKEEFPVPEKLAALKAQRDKEIADVITGKSDKFLAIIGPCSADNEDAVLDYTLRLKRFRKRLPIRFLSCQEYTLTSQEQLVQAIRVCFTSLTLRRSQTFLPDL